MVDQNPESESDPYYSWVLSYWLISWIFMGFLTAWMSKECICIYKSDFKLLNWRGKLVLVVYPILMSTGFIFFNLLLITTLIKEIRLVLIVHTFVMQSSFYIIVYNLAVAKMMLEHQLNRVFLFMTDDEFNAKLK